MYVSMLRCRTLTERAVQQLVGSAPTTDWNFAVGREAIVVGAALDLGLADTVVFSSSNIPAQLARGASLEQVVSQSARKNGSEAVVATEPSAATAVSIDPFNLGTGLALAHKLEKKRNVVLALAAEDTSTADRWHEAMKFAGIHKLPVIYVLQRGSAFDLEPAKRSPALDDLSFVARDCGFPAIIVDSNDAVAMWRVTQESIHRARNGAGPTLIECEIQLTQSAGSPGAHGALHEEARRMG